LQVLAAAALLFPLLLFTFASWLSYRAIQALANERIERSLDVLQEQALKVFQSVNLALDTIDDLLAHRSESEIQADEARLHEQLRRIVGTLPEVQSIWIFGPTGHPEVMTRAYPALTSGDYSENDYFRVPRDGPLGVYIGGIHQSVSGGQPYFTFFWRTALLHVQPSAVWRGRQICRRHRTVIAAKRLQQFLFPPGERRRLPIRADTR
jgi:hypothetical protein